MILGDVKKRLLLTIKKILLMNYQNKTVVVTGAAKGIGASCATIFFEAGANVALLDIDVSERDPLDDRWLFIHCNVSVESEVQSALASVAERYGGVDILVNNAGIQRYGTVTETSVELWDEVMNVPSTAGFRS